MDWISNFTEGTSHPWEVFVPYIKDNLQICLGPRHTRTHQYDYDWYTSGWQPRCKEQFIWVFSMVGMCKKRQCSFANHGSLIIAWIRVLWIRKGASILFTRQKEDTHMSFSTKKTTVDFWYPYSWDVLFPQQVARANNIDGWIVGRIAD